ncbi:Metal-sulfur cluster assembly factor (plasmid) [Cupriavidus necator H16]|uniref:Metal-sulfur cluster assembly factor n=1 Tax=Cupriavidus necator (strain ATCC 17699 / DSM 428 / KCTC 22496 / NCIMB 10442 / H16 / Stanier 337) TaxID=381666 RepID=Q7WXA0_CUPNH|nr:metal-sulfur cluster assembly factor [Cupriavidus necator]AAP85989.1 probable hydroxylase [Cupriavidus necator H16]QCC05475.1 metal-sulfur cluster assembly factor [Cupriavidus necator H16]QQB81296.1 metal-sulfur cluster assembly factor [Cupriavidus necator]
MLSRQASNGTSGFDYQGPEQWLAPITDALRRVVDPELALNVFDVGLIYAVTVFEAGVYVSMTMTSTACPLADMVLDDVHLELEGVMPLGYGIEVELCWEPAWTPERMSASAKHAMGW